MLPTNNQQSTVIISGIENPSNRIHMHRNANGEDQIDKLFCRFGCGNFAPFSLALCMHIYADKQQSMCRHKTNKVTEFT